MNKYEEIFEMLHPGIDHSNIEIEHCGLPNHLLFEVAYFINNALTANVFDYNEIFAKGVKVYDSENYDKYFFNYSAKVVSAGGYSFKSITDADWVNFGSGYGKQACKEAVETLYADLFDTVDWFINYAKDNTSIIKQINPSVVEQTKSNIGYITQQLYDKWIKSYMNTAAINDHKSLLYKYWINSMSSLSIYTDSDTIENESVLKDISKEANIKNIYNKWGSRVFTQVFLHYYAIELYAKAVSQLIMHALEYIQDVQQKMGIVAQQLVTPITPIKLVQPMEPSDVNYAGNAEPINVQNVITPNNLNAQNAAVVNPNANTQDVAANSTNPIPMDMYNALDDNAKNALAMVLNNPQLRADLEQMGNLLGWDKLLAN